MSIFMATPSRTHLVIEQSDGAGISDGLLNVFCKEGVGPVFNARATLLSVWDSGECHLYLGPLLSHPIRLVMLLQHKFCGQ